MPQFHLEAGGRTNLRTAVFGPLPFLRRSTVVSLLVHAALQTQTAICALQVELHVDSPFTDTSHYELKN